MPALPEIEAFADDLVAIRRDIHAHPEIGFEEVRTSALVAEKLASWGVEVHRGIGKTGVVGVLHGAKGPGRRIGLRADMDALPMDEATNLPFSSKYPGKFHGCGHDGHTTMLLGAARYLASNNDFAGTVHFIFQPAEEGLGGARAMLADKLFERFPCDEVYGLHNAPNIEAGKVRIFAGPAQAGADFFDIKITGRGSHGARPEVSRDPVIAATALVQALQSIVSRNADPQHAAVLSVTKIHSGSAYNVIPQEATLGGTTRFFDAATGELMRQRMRTVAAGIAATFEMEIDVEIRSIFDVLVNHEAQSDAAAKSIAKIVGAENLLTDVAPIMGSEDFADMLRAVPGAYFWVGHGGDVPVHNPGFVLDEAILPIGSSLLATVATDRLAAA
ncbi:amidohydrolase [Azorhizobium caulinodans ORS 571]|uniref:Amidohydrolase n=1 Tax=Azorhizobium caulinodans (strain ATCC 43989 / DSM 5975 / JCM 20966 / LMG 6465 / NBRC 14845 / NCIMB 13405 / ORS 571) TaxID=438753 RepID=A8I737_AZOC5|nr:M20 aminoacylase family protein [Azorhizobium caulinodans]BAF88073.1 amidohydrolase [Azorhizobium caulinodans ORS 571]